MPNYSQISSNCSQIYKFINRRTEREQRRIDTREHISSSSSRKGTESRGRRRPHRRHPRWGRTLGTLHLRPHRCSGGGLHAGDVHVGATAAAWGGGKGARARPSRGAALGRWQRSGEGARADADTCKIQRPRIRLRDGPKSLG